MGCRWTAILAGVLYTLGFLISCIAPTLEVLYITLGMTTGFSQSLVSVVIFAIVPYYFNKRLGMAIGLTQVGAGLGLIIFSTLNGYLIAIYGLQGSLLILSGIAANCIPLAIIMQKPTLPQVPQFTENGNETHYLLADDDKISLAEKEYIYAMETQPQQLHVVANAKDNYNAKGNISDEDKNNSRIRSFIYTLLSHDLYS